MKKLLVAVVVASFGISCNHNPQGTGDEILMNHERKINAIEYQKDSITEKDISGTNPSTFDTTKSAATSIATPASKK